MVLIDQQEAAKLIRQNKDTHEDCQGAVHYNRGCEHSAQIVEQMNGQEIIRCKDCKHWIPYDWMFSEVWQSQNMADYPEDEIGCNYCDMAMKANDFCSRAEKRGEE